MIITSFFDLHHIKIEKMSLQDHNQTTARQLTPNINPSTRNPLQGSLLDGVDPQTLMMTMIWQTSFVLQRLLKYCYYFSLSTIKIFYKIVNFFVLFCVWDPLLICNKPLMKHDHERWCNMDMLNIYFLR